jgi:hypothetical protein
MSGIQGQNLGNQNAFGNSGGKSLNDRKLAAEVRTLALKEILKVITIPKVEMRSEEYDLYKSVLVRLAGNVLPKLSEHTGEDGEKLTISISSEIAEKNGIMAVS